MAPKSDVKFTSAATNDSFMLAPSHYTHNDIVALDRAYINYAKFEELTDRVVVSVTNMKKKPQLRGSGGLYASESVSGDNCGNIPPLMADLVASHADKAELPAEIFLR